MYDLAYVHFFVCKISENILLRQILCSYIQKFSSSPFCSSFSCSIFCLCCEPICGSPLLPLSQISP